MNQEAATYPEQRPEEADTGTRSRRVLSIEELRARLGIVGAERPVARTAPAPEGARPRIILRGEALAG